MYKAFQNKKYYLAFHTFPKSAKNLSEVYLSGIRNFGSHDMHTYSIVIYRFRVMFGIKTESGCGECSS